MIFNGELNNDIVIYKIISPSNKVYIGQTSNFKRRYLQYKNKQCKFQKILFNSIVKYGIENHIIEIIEKVNLNNINEREIFWIDFYKSNYNKYPLNNGMNLCDGGNSVKGCKRSEEHKRKIGESSRNRKYSQEFKDGCAKRALNNKNMLGKKHSDKTKEQISLSRKGKLTGANNTSSKKVIDTKTLVIYDSIKEASKHLPISLLTLRRYLNKILPNKTSLIFLDEYKKL